ncbi:hypothetical protein J7T55_015766 [Diaporthe amygdali]|uniref:uncharacterized protein n=1 Tax=Phomopsis amygdali TaxID=1214568 RepID=UPI0022FE6443|nr:uncharacterized protein J7T55_015766 [Diaporthe amygdali]KAJ0107301.1 hypothetical protein J7T55_015766 [Diaporthe amygdali]
MVNLRNHDDDTEQSPTVKRRKIRKGTQSCWECKRRKIRCTFATPNDSICDGCRSRRVKCIGQEFDDGDVSAAKKTGGMSRKETAVGRVSKKGTDLITLQDHGGEDTRQKGMGIPRSAVHNLGELSSSYKIIMSRLVETASKLVTSDHELVSSLEGIECIMIEAMYHNNAGNLRRAWVTHRRAMTIAQMMGLHRGVSPPTALLDVHNRDRISPEHMWCRLIISDRYLSLMLGLPQGSLESPFGTPQALDSCIPLERMERIESIAGGLILQRNEADLHNLVKTQEVDKILQEAAALMPPQWWLTPKIATVVGHDKEALRETLRLMNQFTHYHLLAQLHLPHLLQDSDSPRYDYSKITAVTASREILSRFVHFRASVTVAAYCRGIDVLAFIASTVLSLAHIDARRRQRIATSGCGAALHLVAHQRRSDRGLLEQTLQRMDEVNERGEDAMACKISSILQHLLAIEDAAANDDYYNATISSKAGEPEPQHDDKSVDVGQSLQIHVPYFGTITIESRAASMPVRVEQALSDDTTRSSPVLDVSYHDSESSFKPALEQNRKRKQCVRNSPFPISDPAGYRFGGDSANTDWQTVPCNLDSLRTNEQSAPVALGASSPDSERIELNMATLLVPGLTTDVDDWALQGVDLALFDSLIRGSAGPDVDP